LKERIMAINLNRRSFLASASGLVVAVAIPVDAAGPSGMTSLHAYVHIKPNGSVHVHSPVTECGQGTHTAHCAIVADELGIDIASVSIETGMPADAFRRGTAPNKSMGTGGSWGVRHWYEPMRKGAAQAREMLIAAAAQKLGVEASTLIAQSGAVVHAASGRTLGFGALAASAAKMTPPENPVLRPKSELKYSRSELRRVDIPAKVAATHKYTSDMVLPGMVYACAKLNPVYRGEAESFNKASALKVKGVLDVIAIPGGAAVVARSSWAAMQGAEALDIVWKPSKADALSSAEISAAIKEGLGASDSAIARQGGDVTGSIKNATTVISVDYEVPYLLHAPMEPWNCIVHDTGRSLDFWGPVQAQDRFLSRIAAVSKYAPENIRLHTVMPGGGFGRRLSDDGVPGAVIVAQALKRPVKFFYTRETDLAVGWLRPAQGARLQASFDAAKNLTSWSIRTSGPSMRMDFGAPGSMKVGDLDGASVQNLSDIRYKIPNHKFDYAMRHLGPPTAPWRAVGATHNAFFVECFIDEIAAFMAKDPLELRRSLLAHDPRALAVINDCAAASGWSTAAPQGRARGFSYFESYGSLCAQVVEASITDGKLRVHKVITSLDCGDVISPDGARSQIEGGVIQGLSAAIGEALTVEKGRGIQTNFDSYSILRIGDAPTEIISRFVISGAPLGGVGEPPVPPVFAALANAVSKLTGKPVRKLPINEV
jgi:isoquinoline 1-oxidoreductase subunit beta